MFLFNLGLTDGSQASTTARLKEPSTTATTSKSLSTLFFGYYHFSCMWTLSLLLPTSICTIFICKKKRWIFIENAYSFVFLFNLGRNDGSQVSTSAQAKGPSTTATTGKSLSTPFLVITIFNIYPQVFVQFLYVRKRWIFIENAYS